MMYNMYVVYDYILQCHVCVYNMENFSDLVILRVVHGDMNVLCPTDMEKFPVRMKDNDLLVTQLFEDPCKEAITALSVYFTPNVCKSCDMLSTYTICILAHRSPVVIDLLL